MAKKYAQRDIDSDAVADHYDSHVDAMTGEGLCKKSAIAAELAYRDSVIESLERERDALREALEESTELLERIAQGEDWGAIEEYIQDNHEALAKGATQ